MQQTINAHSSIAIPLGSGPPGPAGPPGPSATVSITATESIPAFSAVTSTGKVANGGNTAFYGKVIGIALVAIANGFSGSVAEAGEVTNPAWTWSAGDLIFINGGVLSSVAPSTGWSQAVGTAKSPITIIVDLSPPILL